MKPDVRIVGAGLAGCEAAWQCAKRGARVELTDMKPFKKSPAHTSDDFCELVCSNSFKAEGLSSGTGLLKQEMALCDSLILKSAYETRVPAGAALAVDREAFAKRVTETLKNLPNVTVTAEEITTLDHDVPTIIAAGPLASEALSSAIRDAYGEGLSFFDAAAPLIEADSIDLNKAYFASRYGKGTADYLNCPMNKDEYDAFYQAMVSAETAHLHGFENDRVFEGCIPIEVLAARGYDTMRFGPLKPVGLRDPRSERPPYAVVQLRRDNAASSLFNIVGFQTHLTFSEQRRVFRMIPGLENAEFARYGVMHRNTFLNSPGLLTPTFAVRDDPTLRFAGQITGVEGYLPSAASGLIAGINAVCGDSVEFPRETALGALSHYISDGSLTDFQPMSINFGILPPLTGKVPKKEKKERLSLRALETLKEFIAQHPDVFPEEGANHGN